jgi:hypothetical protein
MIKYKFGVKQIPKDEAITEPMYVVDSSGRKVYL